MTIFLAKIWGPVILTIGFGIFVSNNYYIKIYRDLEKNALAVFLFGMIAMVGGIVQVLFHNIWDSFIESVITILGWGLLIKGLIFVIAPGFVDRVGDFWADKKLVSLAGFLSFVLGAYITWFAYFV